VDEAVDRVDVELVDPPVGLRVAGLGSRDELHEVGVVGGVARGPGALDGRRRGLHPRVGEGCAVGPGDREPDRRERLGESGVAAGRAPAREHGVGSRCRPPSAHEHSQVPPEGPV
jgi:hypothetical protein